MLDKTIQTYLKKILVRYNCNLFNSKKRPPSCTKLNSSVVYQDIDVFYSQLENYFMNLPKDLVFYLPERRGLRSLSTYLTEKGVSIRTKKICPGAFTNPQTEYFLDKGSYFFLNSKRFGALIKELKSVGGSYYGLEVLVNKDKKLPGLLMYNHRSIKALLIFFYCYLVTNGIYDKPLYPFLELLNKTELFAKGTPFSLVTPTYAFDKGS